MTKNQPSEEVRAALDRIDWSRLDIPRGVVEANPKVAEQLASGKPTDLITYSVQIPGIPEPTEKTVRLVPRHVKDETSGELALDPLVDCLVIDTDCRVNRNKPILDPCCGSRMFYFDKEDPRVLFGDIRHLDTTLTDGNAPGGVRELHIHPDMEMDFRDLPFEDGTFPLVLFDPPHLRKAGKTSWLAQKYGTLPDFGWKEYLGQGLAECWRVLRPQGTLIFKWNEQQIKFGDLEDIFPAKPVIRFSPKEKTIFIVFFKEI